jgi:hypothetical protein
MIGRMGECLIQQVAAAGDPPAVSQAGPPRR